MGDLVIVDFTQPARPRRRALYTREPRCPLCKRPVVGEVGAVCVGCITSIDAAQDAHRSRKLRDEAARLCCGCLWPIAPRTQLAVAPDGDLMHVECAEERALERMPSEGSNAS